MFENVDGRTTDGRTTDARVTGILIAHLGAFGSGELKKKLVELKRTVLMSDNSFERSIQMFEPMNK